MPTGTLNHTAHVGLPIWRDPAAWARAADVFAVLIALALPWSTSLVAIFVVGTGRLDTDKGDHGAIA